MELLHRLIGSDADTITWWQMVCRGTIIFLYTLFLVRIGGRRIFGRYTSFDIVLAVILGSIMSRAMTGNAKFLPTLATATVLVALHALIAKVTYRTHVIGPIIKGREVPLIEKGHINQEVLRKHNITQNDLLESLRTNGGVQAPHDVKAAYLERSGEISVIK